MTQVKISNASTPASVGADVMVTDEEANVSRWQFVIIAARVFYARQMPDGTWSTLSAVVSPERFGAHGPKFSALSSWVARFFGGE